MNKISKKNIETKQYINSGSAPNLGCGAAPGKKFPPRQFLYDFWGNNDMNSPPSSEVSSVI